MDEDMSNSEMIRDLAEENQTRKILELLNESQDIEEAKKKVKDLLEK